ncbi:MAG TPA: SH3 domain-containing protein [Aggregatilineaceae bacterium]|nr:SH3 domain-containing protein [Aggregatilineaceae bacterium]
MRRLVLVMILALLVALNSPFRSAPGVTAQEGDQCTQFVTEALNGVRAACTDLAPGEVCYGSAGVTGTLTDTSATFGAAGDTVTLDGLDGLATVSANPESGEWGVAMLMLPAGLADGAVTAVLFGEAQMAKPVVAETPDRPTLTITNGGSAPINLRGGAGTTYAAVGELLPDTSAVADGRNEQADWVRIQMPDGTAAWVFVRLIEWEGDNSAITALDVLAPDDVSPVFVASEPFQSFTLTTGTRSELCGAAPSGLLLQYAGENPAIVQINQVTLAFSDATLLVHAAANESLSVMVLSGSVTATTRGQSADAAAGEAITVSLGGADGLAPVATPTLARSYAFGDVVDAPVTLLPGTLTCVVGVPADGGTITMRVGPGEERGPLNNMNSEASYSVIGWANDPNNAPWWQLETGDQDAWVPQSGVGMLGDCSAVAQVEPPPLTFAPPVPGSGDTSSAGDTGEADFSPAAQTVWQMYPGSDNMSGTCSGAPAINFCDHLAAITPAEGGIMWRGMEAKAYYLTRIQPNVYAYSGPNVLGTGTISMTLRFTSDSTVEMVQSLTLSSEPNCQHTYNYTGSKNW